MNQDRPQSYVDIVTLPDGSWTTLPPGHDDAVRKLAACLLTNEGEAELNRLLPSGEVTREYAHTLAGAAIRMYTAWVVEEAASSMLPLWLQRLDAYIRYLRRIAP
jgi:hypothetical protein